VGEREERRPPKIPAAVFLKALRSHPYSPSKALMLFGTFHLMHTIGDVSTYEKNYPNVTFVISDLAAFDTELPTLSASPFVSWPIPSLARAKGTWLGALDLTHFFPPPLLIDNDCSLHNEFPAKNQWRSWPTPSSTLVLRICG
jgi:hypothetical protein